MQDRVEAEDGAAEPYTIVALEVSQYQKAKLHPAHILLAVLSVKTVGDDKKLYVLGNQCAID